MNRARAAFASALLGAALSAPVAAPRSLYAAPSQAAGESAVSGSPAQASEAAEEKFRKFQKEMQSAPGPASAPAPSGSARTEGVSVGNLALQIVFGLAFVLILAVISIRFLKRMQRGLLTGPRPGGDVLEVLETCHLGPQQKVIALRMHDEVGVLGVTKEGIRLLTVLKQPAAELRRGGESNPAAFSDNLNKLLDRFKKPKKVSDMLDEAEG